MKLNKREFMALSAGSAAALTMSGSLAGALAEAGEVDKLIKAFTGGKQPNGGRITINTPEIAENGNTVPVSFDVESPMSADDYVASVLLLADGNPRAGVATLHFSPMSGEASATTRIRLAKTQNIVAVAKMSNGSVYMEKKQVKVTIGGCGG